MDGPRESYIVSQKEKSKYILRHIYMESRKMVPICRTETQMQIQRTGAWALAGGRRGWGNLRGQRCACAPARVTRPAGARPPHSTWGPDPEGGRLPGEGVSVYATADSS